jgi:predicted O-methyltransferase YrrM
MRPELDNLPSPNWFHHGEEILTLLELNQAKICVELGSNRGCSAIAMARLIRKWGGKLTCVDTWSQSQPGYVDLADFVANVAAAGVTETVDAIRRTTLEAAADWDRGPIDALYVDAGHTKEECLADLKAWWPHIRVGGLVIGDDYDDPHGIPALGVTAAWDAFEQTYAQPFTRVTTAGGQLAGGSRLIWGLKR